MKLIELHILQSFPVSCLNRDDVGAPKTAVFGGVNRARISSQCLKRATRRHAKERSPTLFSGTRTKYLVKSIAEGLIGLSVPEERANILAKCASHYIAKLDSKDKTQQKSVVLMYFSPGQIQSLCEAILKADEGAIEELIRCYKACGNKIIATSEEAEDDETQDGEEELLVKRNKGKGSTTVEKLNKAQEKALDKAFGKNVFSKALISKVLDAAVITLFGRMVANDATLTLEGAAMFSHALSTHQVDNDIDFYAAADDCPLEQTHAGAAMLGTLEFNSGVYYRYVAINLDMLFDGKHLHGLPLAERKEVVNTFVQAVLMSVPGARKNSMNAHTLPAYVLGVLKDCGQPIQLSNAFEQPVSKREGGLINASIERLQSHFHDLNKTWNIELKQSISMPECSLHTFCEEIVSHVE